MDTPIQSYTGQATEASKVMPTRLPPACIRGASDEPSALNEKALVRKACSADSGGVSRKPPPSASARREGDRVENAVDRAPA